MKRTARRHPHFLRALLVMALGFSGSPAAGARAPIVVTPAGHPLGAEYPVGSLAGAEGLKANSATERGLRTIAFQVAWAPVPLEPILMVRTKDGVRIPVDTFRLVEGLSRFQVVLTVKEGERITKDHLRQALKKAEEGLASWLEEEFGVTTQELYSSWPEASEGERFDRQGFVDAGLVIGAPSAERKSPASQKRSPTIVVDVNSAVAGAGGVREKFAEWLKYTYGESKALALLNTARPVSWGPRGKEFSGYLFQGSEKGASVWYMGKAYDIGKGQVPPAWSAFCNSPETMIQTPGGREEDFRA